METAKSSFGFVRLQYWYDRNCNDVWEHDFGINIETLDNPGWMIRVDLSGTAKEKTPFAKIDEPLDQEHWVSVTRESDPVRGHPILRGACGPKDLERLLTVICDWLETE